MNKKTSAEKKFLHDIATPLSIAILITKKLLKSSIFQGSEESDDLKKIKKLVEALNKIEELHAEHKKYVFEKEN